MPPRRSVGQAGIQVPQGRHNWKLPEWELRFNPHALPVVTTSGAPCRQLLQGMQKILKSGRVVEEFFCGGAHTIDTFAWQSETRSDAVEELPFAVVPQAVEPEMDKRCLRIWRRPFRIDFPYAVLGSAPLITLTIRPSFSVCRFGFFPLGEKIVDPFGSIG
jgi:hypothetical protein